MKVWKGKGIEEKG